VVAGIVEVGGFCDVDGECGGGVGGEEGECAAGCMSKIEVGGEGYVAACYVIC
jgi:hypothetical protein